MRKAHGSQHFGRQQKGRKSQRGQHNQAIANGSHNSRRFVTYYNKRNGNGNSSVNLDVIDEEKELEFGTSSENFDSAEYAYGAGDDYDWDEYNRENFGTELNEVEEEYLSVSQPGTASAALSKTKSVVPATGSASVKVSIADLIEARDLKKASSLSIRKKRKTSPAKASNSKTKEVLDMSASNVTVSSYAVLDQAEDDLVTLPDTESVCTEMSYQILDQIDLGSGDKLSATPTASLSDSMSSLCDLKLN